MLTLKMITENRDEVVRRLGKKHFAPAAEMIDRVIELDLERRNSQQKNDALLAQINQNSKSIGALMKAGKKEEVDTIKATVSQLKEQTKELQEKITNCETEIRNILLQVPNLPNETECGTCGKWCCQNHR